MVLAACLGAEVGLSILLYYASDLKHNHGIVAKRILFMIAAVTTLALWLGTYELTRDIAKATKLLGGA
jgi:hypothetical protein